MADLDPPAKLHVVFAEHVSDEQLLGYEHALGVGNLLTRLPGKAYVVEVRNPKKLEQHRSALPHWERSGVCTSWWIKEPEN